MNKVDSSIQYLKSVGPKRAEAFSNIGIHNIKDLLFYFPYKHIDRSLKLSTIDAFKFLQEGKTEEISIIGKVKEVRPVYNTRKKFLVITFGDDSGEFECVWFQGVKYYSKLFNLNDTYIISGKPTYSFGNIQFVHPDFDNFSDEETQKLLNTGKIVPVYSLHKDLKTSNIGTLSLRKIISNALENYLGALEETLPQDIISKYNLLPLKEAVLNNHYPQSYEQLNRAKFRFKFEELFYFELIAASKRIHYKLDLSGTSMKIKTDLISSFLKILPFELTNAQLKVLSEIRKDMADDKPMNRLLQGDVGSGKTIVALIAMLIAADNNYQSVLMAPTEILASQHAKNISALLNTLGKNYIKREIKVSLLMGGQRNSAKRKKETDEILKESDIIIGTHALIEDDIEFNNVKFIIIDEQHRFGVEQRSRLLSKGSAPDVLVMSATPIPRTLSMTYFGDLDVSIIDQMPKDRKPVKTYLRGEDKLPGIYNYIVEQAKAGVQSFVVYPLVEESDKLELKAAMDYYNILKDTYFKDISTGLLHGKMNWKQKEEEMLKFKNKEYQVLISTIIIEVGIDIPSANIILINDAHRFGLSQLHQMRGRVGRSDVQAYCILCTKDEIVARSSSIKNFENLSAAFVDRLKTVIRLNAMVKYTDGFKLSEIDLKLRGPGNIYGIQQSGYPELKYADITEDYEILQKTHEIAFLLINDDPALNKPSNIILKKMLKMHYSDNLKYSSIA